MARIWDLHLAWWEREQDFNGKGKTQAEPQGRDSKEERRQVEKGRNERRGEW